MFDYLYYWPKDLPDLQDSTLDPHDRICILIRNQSFQQAESLILASISIHLDELQSKSTESTVYLEYLCLLFWVHRLKFNFIQSTEVINTIQGCIIADEQHKHLYQFCYLSHLLDTDDASKLHALASSDWFLDSKYFPFKLLHSNYLLKCGRFEESLQCLDSLSDPFSTCFEALSTRSLIYQCLQDWAKVFEIQLQCSSEFPEHAFGFSTLLIASVEARSHEHAIPLLRKAIEIHGHHPYFLSHFCRISLLKDRIADARRYSLLDRTFKFSNINHASNSLTNLLVTQDRLGYSEWLNYLPMSSDEISSLPLQMLEPMLLQNASINGDSSLTKCISRSILSQFDKSSQPFLFRKASPKKNLTIAWICTDLAYHPVARFLYGFFSSLFDPIHNHILVDANDNQSESTRGWFEPLTSLSVVNLGITSLSRKISSIRDLDADIAIDLAGWTGSNLLRGFHSGLAPIQVNYLGYFSTSCLSNMNYWLGDKYLFPDTFSEWHTESIYCLPRCFISWNPVSPLPEASVDVCDPHNSPTVNFGSFNNTRKLSNYTINIWAKILSQIPNSKLVLKAGNVDDTATQQLLRRRLSRLGLDTSQVIWLPRTSTPVEHLQQYQHIDIALDPFPNGGCTTTCEALWMGVPVITLTGQSYASNMSSAVLHGAGLGNLCANNSNDYVRIALQLASNIQSLRHTRDHWRNCVINSQLGDTTGLMNHLESAFSSMYTNSL